MSCRFHVCSRCVDAHGREHHVKGLFLEILSRTAAHHLSQVRMVGNGVNEIVHISEAFSRAEDLGLDLVLVSTDVTPPVVRIQDFKKIEYEKKKARKASKQVSSLKEVQFKVNISDHDLATKISKIEKFLERGDKVKISVKLKGRERESPERAHELLRRVENTVDCKISRIPGPMPMTILEPAKTSSTSKKAKVGSKKSNPNSEERKERSPSNRAETLSSADNLAEP